MSPGLGVLFNFDGAERSTRRLQLGSGETAKFNGMIVERSMKQLYAATELALSQLPTPT